MKYWQVWLRVPPRSPEHHILNWILMIAGSASFLAAGSAGLFLVLWSLIYVLVWRKESIASGEYLGLFALSEVIGNIRLKSRKALVKAAAVGVLGAVVLIRGRASLLGPVTTELAVLYIVLLWSGYALVRDLFSYLGYRRSVQPGT